MKKNGVFLFVISHLIPEVFKIFVLCKLGTDDVERCENISGRNDANELEFGKHVVHYEMRHMTYIFMLLWQHSCLQSLSAVNQILPV